MRRLFRLPVMSLIVVCLVAGGAGVGAIAQSARAAQEPTVTIMVGGLDKIIYLPAMLTQQLGYFQDEGLNVKLIGEAAGVESTTALLAGQVDAVVGFYDHTIDIQGKGKKLESVVQLDWVPGEAEMVASKEADTIKSPADFKGKNLGVTGIGSSTDFLTHYLAAKNGVSGDQIKIVPVGAGNTFIAAIQHGTIDAGMTTDPTISRLVKTGEAKVLIDMRTAEGTRQALGGTYPAACLYMRSDYVAQHPDITQKLANAFVRTLVWIHSHNANEIADKMPADYYAGDKDLYLTALQSSLDMFTPTGLMPEDGPPTVLKVLSAFDPNVQGKQIDLSQTYTTQFVEQAMKNLNISATPGATPAA